MRFVFVITLLMAPIAWGMKRVHFAIPSADKMAILNGEIDFPSSGASGPMPAIILVGGSGLFDRDYFFGNSGTDADFLFRTIADKGTKNSFAVIRFDYRGVRCNRRTAPSCLQCRSDLEKRQSYVQHCIDNEIRAAVTPGNIQDDILSIYNFVLKNPAIDPHKIVVFAHSEGTIHVSYLVSQKRINPRGLLYMGAVGESPQSIMRWQVADLNGKIAKILWWPMDLNKDGIISNVEIESVCKGSDLSEEVCTSLKASGEQWTDDTLKERLLWEYHEIAQDALNHKDSDSFMSENADAGAVFASYAWWKMFFNDSTEIASLLAEYSGRLSVNNGSLDISTPGAREAAYFKKHLFDWDERFRLNTLEGLGHSLGNHIQVGPIRSDSIDHLVKEFDWLVQ